MKWEPPAKSCHNPLRLILYAISAALSLCVLSYANADDWNGPEYYKHSSPQKEAAADLMKFVPLRGNERILDVGCGDGKITARLADQLPTGSIVGLDISPSMIEFAQKTFSKAEHPNLSFVLLDAQKIEYDNEFDILVSFMTLMWLKDHVDFLTRAHKSLKSEGVLAVNMPICPPKALVEAVNEVTAKAEWSSYFANFSTGWNFVTADAYGPMLLNTGFVPTRLAVVRQKDVFPNRKAFELFLSQFFPYLRPLPQELKKPFLDQVLDRFIDISRFPDGEVHWEFPRLEVVASKATIDSN